MYGVASAVTSWGRSQWHAALHSTIVSGQRRTPAQDTVLGVMALSSPCLTGCATKIRNVPTYGHRAIDHSLERDRRQCETAITGRLRARGSAELEYAACMIAELSTYVQVVDASVDVRKASVRVSVTQARILDDLLTCEILVDGTHHCRRIGRPMLSVRRLLLAASIGSFAASATLFVLASASIPGAWTEGLRRHALETGPSDKSAGPGDWGSP